MELNLFPLKSNDFFVMLANENYFFQLAFFAVFIYNLDGQPPIKHAFACKDYTQGQVCIISEEVKESFGWQRLTPYAP